MILGFMGSSVCGDVSLILFASLTFFAIYLTFIAMSPVDVVFHLVPRFSMISLYGALEPLRLANRFAGQVFSWRFVSADGEPVSASNDIPVSVSGRLADVGRPTMLMVSASYEPEKGISKPTLVALRKLAAAKVLLAGMDTGPLFWQAPACWMATRRHAIGKACRAFVKVFRGCRSGNRFSKWTGTA